jgi:hypothetical protein
MKIQTGIKLEISIFFIFIFYFFIITCVEKPKNEERIQTLNKLYENGFSKIGYTVNNKKVGKWIWRDSITNEKLIEFFYSDTLLGENKNNLTIKKYFEKNKLFLIEKIINENQIIGLKVIDTNMYKDNILNDKEYHEAGQGIFLFYCSNCHFGGKKIINNLEDVDTISIILKQNKVHKNIKLNKEEINQIYYYLKKIN